MPAICVFCGSGPGKKPAYTETARRTGATLAARGITLVYGGGGKGMMGAVADGALDAGGRVVGVIPHWMVEKEAAHTGVDEMIHVETMLERKQRMAELSDAFLVLPGGLGTLDELFEMATWSQLDLHAGHKPQAIVNCEGYYDHLIAWLGHAVSEGYIRPDAIAMPSVHETVPGAVEALLHP